MASAPQSLVLSPWFSALGCEHSAVTGAKSALEKVKPSLLGPGAASLPAYGIATYSWAHYTSGSISGRLADLPGWGVFFVFESFKKPFLIEV